MTVELRGLLGITLTALLKLALGLTTTTVLITAALLLFLLNIKILARLSMRSEQVRRFVHRHITWYLVEFRIKFLSGYSWFNEIDDTVILGALPIPENIPSLQRAKVKLIITLCEPFELDPIYSEQEFEKMGFVNKRYSVPDAYGAPEISHLVEILTSIAETERSGYKTYVHCKAGRGRSASTVLCYLIFRYNVSVEWALTVLKKLRFEVSPKPLQLLRAREFRQIYTSIPELSGVAFNSTNFEILDSSRFKYALRAITTERKRSFPACQSIVHYKNRLRRFSVYQDAVGMQQGAGERRVSRANPNRPLRRSRSSYN